MNNNTPITENDVEDLYDEEEEEKDLDEFLEEYKQKIPNLEKYCRCVFYGPGIYFVIYGYSIAAISDDPGCYVKGGQFPPFKSEYIDPTKKELRFIRKMMRDFGFKPSFLDKVVDAYNGKFGESEVIDFFQKAGDKKSLTIFRKIVRRVKTKASPFKSLSHFLSAFDKYGTPEDLYYEWEDWEVNLHENVMDTDEGLDYFDMDKEEWINLLNTLDERIVMPDDF